MATGNVSLLDTAKNMAPSREKAAILTYATTSHVLAHLPLEAQPTGVKKWKLVNDIAYTTSAAAYRNIGSEYTATKTPTSNFAANVKIAGGRVQLDRVLKKLSPENISIERRGQIAANARRITIDIFEGSGGSAIWGIDNWINVSTVFANQSMDMGTASTGGLITEDGLDEFLTLLNVIPGQTFIYCNDAPSRRIKKLSRGQGTASSGGYFYNVNYRPEEFGFFAGMYDGIPIIPLVDGKGTDMLSNTEGDGSSTTLYGVTYGDENYTGFQQSPMEFIDMKEVSVLEAFDLEHLMNAVPQNIKCIARMRYVKNAVS
jgi:hypothetical protein